MKKLDITQIFGVGYPLRQNCMTNVKYPLYITYLHSVLRNA